MNGQDMSGGMGGGGVPAEWTKAIIVPVYQGKGRRGECESYRGISVEYTQKGIWKSHNRGCNDLQKRKSVKNKKTSEREGDAWIRYFPSGW